MKRIFVVPLFLLFCNFGKYVHTIINSNVVKICANNRVFNDIFTNAKKNEFINRAAEPDERKWKDHSEKTKHFFHYNLYNEKILKKFINYDEFLKRLEKNFKENVKTNIVDVDKASKNISKFVKSHGELPWSILETINKLKGLVEERKSLFENKKNLLNKKNATSEDENEAKKRINEVGKNISDTDKKILYECINLAHYVADLFTPLHLNSYYDGKYYLQNGIHSFWETLLPVQCKGNYKLELINLKGEIRKFGLENYIFKLMKDSYDLSEKILEEEAGTIFEKYKRARPDIYYEKRFLKKEYKVFADQYFHDDTAKQISLAISFIVYLFNNLIFV